MTSGTLDVADHAFPTRRSICWSGSAETISSDRSGRIRAISCLGRELILLRSDLDALRASVRGSIFIPTDEGYGTRRRLWNGVFDRYPAVIVQCVGAADVVQAIAFARSHDLLTAVRGGGHSLSGQSVCDGGLVIDLSGMRAVRIDVAAQTAQAQGGVLLGELDREAQAFGLVTTMGTAPDTGIGGLTLGGGIGRLARKYGLACDNLISVDIVTANGELLHASERENVDLYWAVRGGGGNFGVVTQFEYRVHFFGPNVLHGWIYFPFENASRTLLSLMEFAEGAPDEMYLTPCIGPEGNVVSCEVCYCGAPSEGERLLASVRKIDKVLSDSVAIKPYLQAQRRNDGLPPYSGYYYESGFVIPNVTAAVSDVIIESIPYVPDVLRSIALLHLGGAAGRPKPEATAFWNRHANLDLLVWGGWSMPGDTGKNVAEMREYWRRLAPVTKGYYVNTDISHDEHRLRETYGGNYARLVEIKNKYDPTNLFRLNANIKPNIQKDGC